MESFDCDEFWCEVEKLNALSQMSRIRVVQNDPSILRREMAREAGVTKDQLLPSGSAKYVQPTVSQDSKPSIAPKPSKIKSLSQFTVRSKHAEFSPVTSKDNLPNLHVSQEPEPDIITEVVEIPSSQSTPLVPPPDLSESSSRPDSHPDSCVSPWGICFYCKSPMENSYRCFQCICEKCGNNCSNGYCTVCNRFIQQYSCEFCGGPHYESVCQSENSFVYEQFSDNNQNFQNDQYPYDSPYQTQQFNCCEYCGGSHFSSDCQTGNSLPCNNYDYQYQDQPPQYQPIQATPQETNQDWLLETQESFKKLNEELTKNSLRNAPSLSCAKCGGPHDDNQCQPSGFDTSTPPQFSSIPYSSFAIGKGMEELLAEQRAVGTHSNFLNTALINDDDDSDDEDTIGTLPKELSSSLVEIPQIQTLQGEKNITESPAVEIMKLVDSITASPSHLPESAVITTEVSTHSLIMGDEPLDTIPAKESDIFIKSSVENLVSIPRESQGTLDHMCDIPPPLFFSKDHSETSPDSNDDLTSHGEVEYVEVSLPHSDVNFFLEEFTNEHAHMDSLPSGSDDDLSDSEADVVEVETLLNSKPNIELSDSHTDDHSLSCEDISYVDEFPSKLVSLEEENDEVTGIKDEALRATLLKVKLLISKIEAFNEKPISSPIPIKDSDSLSDDSIPEMEAFYFDMGEVISGNTTSHSHNSLPDYESFTFEEFPKELTHINVEYDSFTFEEFSLELTQPEYDSFHFDLDIPIICLDQTSLTNNIHEPMNAPAEDDELVMIFIMTFFLFFTYRVTSPVLHSFGSEDIIFDPGILIYKL